RDRRRPGGRWTGPRGGALPRADVGAQGQRALRARHRRGRRSVPGQFLPRGPARAPGGGRRRPTGRAPDAVPARRLSVVTRDKGAAAASSGSVPCPEVPMTLQPALLAAACALLLSACGGEEPHPTAASAPPPAASPAPPAPAIDDK